MVSRGLHMKRTHRQGFTLIEIMIVVVIMGILAAVVAAQISNTTRESQQLTLKSQVQSVRRAVELYKIQHDDQWPTASGAPTTAGVDWSLLTTVTTGGDGRQYGPYLPLAPGNSLVGNSTAFGTDAAAAWHMDGSTGLITATGAD